MKALHSLRQWRPSRLGMKLFAAILSVNVAIAASVFLAVTYSIDRGFLDYLNQAQERRATLLADGLITRWETQNSWAWLEEAPDRWPYIVRFELGRSIVIGHPPGKRRISLCRVPMAVPLSPRRHPAGLPQLALDDPLQRSGAQWPARGHWCPRFSPTPGDDGAHGEPLSGAPAA